MFLATVGHYIGVLIQSEIKFSLKKMLRIYLVLVGAILATYWFWQKYGMQSVIEIFFIVIFPMCMMKFTFLGLTAIFKKSSKKI